jgi:aminopeptidase YwaD
VERRIRDHLAELTRFSDRHVGGPGNLAATEYFSAVASAAGWQLSRTRFDCLEWECGLAKIEVGGELVTLHAGPYSLPCDVDAVLEHASSVEEIEGRDLSGAVLLVHGALASGQLMPKNFTFYNPAEHKRIIAAIETAAPVAVIAATGTDPYLVGGQYPFPLFEDGDFDVPNGYLRDVDGDRLLDLVGKVVHLQIDSRRVPTHAEHVVATLPGRQAERIVVSAHIDSRKDSPGALDNATGVATLLAVAESLGDRHPELTIELVPFNGEDNYANPGEMMWVAENEGSWDTIVLGVNIDDAGLVDTENNVSFYGCPPDIEEAVREAMGGRSRLSEGPKWGQGDHAILGLYGRPALAIASSGMRRFMEQYAHTERDTVDLADPGLVAEAADLIVDIVGRVCALRGRE